MGALVAQVKAGMVAGAALVAAGTLALVGLHNPAVPGYLLNPAVTRATVKRTVCVPGWADTQRPDTSYTTALKRRQLPPGARLGDYEEDHLIPLSLGGAPRETRNLRPVPWPEAHRKNRDELRAHRDLCAGRTTLAAARARMYADWH